MKKFEYKVTRFDSDSPDRSTEWLNDFGSEGWEVVEKIWQEGQWIWLLMKREKPAGGKGKWV